MRIVVAFQLHPPVVLGGAEVGGDLLARELARHADVLRVTPSWDGRVAAREGLDVFEAGGDPRSVADGLRAGAHGVPALRAALRRFAADWVLANTTTAAPWALAAARSLPRGPRVAVLLRDYGFLCPTHACRLFSRAGDGDCRCGLVRFVRTCSVETMRRYPSTRQGLDYRLGLTGRFLAARLNARTAARADVLLAVSRHLARTAAAALSRPVVPIGSGVEAARVPAARPAPNGVCTVGLFARGSLGKGAHVLGEASRLLGGEAWRFVAWGEPGNADEGLVVRRPRVEPAEARRLMAEVDLVAVPSVSPEALGRTALEAQLAGTPIVAADGYGVPEAVAPTGGLLAPRGDGPGLAAALVEARRRLEAGAFDLDAARRWIAERHGVERVAARVLEALDRGGGR